MEEIEIALGYEYSLELERRKKVISKNRIYR